MDTEKLRTFLTIARSGSFSAAADELYLTASAVSKHISALESELGCALFRRGAKTVTLTPEGECCLCYAKTIVAACREMTEEISGRSCLELLSIPFQQPFARLIEGFSRAQPQLRLTLVDRHGPLCVRAVENGEYELALVGEYYSRSEKLDRLVFARERVGAVVSSSHPLAANGRISLRELEREPMYFLSPETGIQRFYLEMCRSAGFEPRIAGYRSREDAIVSLVSSGGASLMLPSDVEPFDRGQVRLLELEEPYFVSSCLIKQRGRALSHKAQLLWDYVAEST